MRVIYSARTVASRLPVITHQFEQNVTHDPPRTHFDIPYAEFLKIHYKGVTTMPGDETDGCEPDVSPFEIATQSWKTFDLVYKQTHNPEWLAERDHVEHLAIAYEPQNMIDLNWKIQLLSTVNRAKYAAQIDKLIDQLYSYETPEGGWPYPFDKKAKPADFISYNAVLALAEAGRRPETDEHLARAVKAMMAAQRPEGSWEGDPVYQGFNTPFRATQFAVMSLATLYPGTTKAKNWDAAYPAPPTKLAKNNLPLLLAQLDQYWDLAPEPVLRQIRQLLVKSDQPLAREAAARALGHMADPGRMPVLIQALGDPDQDGADQRGICNSHGVVTSAGSCPRRTQTAGGRSCIAQCAHSLGRRTRFQPAFQGLDWRSGFAGGSGERSERPCSLRPVRSRLRFMALVLLASGPAGCAPQHSGNIGDASQHRDRTRWFGAGSRRVSTTCWTRTPDTSPPGCERVLKMRIESESAKAMKR